MPTPAHWPLDLPSRGDDKMSIPRIEQDLSDIHLFTDQFMNDGDFGGEKRGWGGAAAMPSRRRAVDPSMSPSVGGYRTLARLRMTAGCLHSVVFIHVYVATLVPSGFCVLHRDIGANDH